MILRIHAINFVFAVVCAGFGHQCSALAAAGEKVLFSGAAEVFPEEPEYFSSSPC
jgi:hypothetical protein